MIWKFNTSDFTLSYLHNLNISGAVFHDMIDALYVWNNGAQLFVGSSNGLVKAYLFDNSTGQYIVNGMTPNLGDYIYAVWVSASGNKMLVAVRGGCKALDYISSSWSINTPSFLSTLGPNHFIYLMPTSDRQRIII